MIEKLKQNKLILIILIIAIILIITGVTYSFYKIKLEGQKTHIISSDLISFTYKESEDKIFITNTTPINDINGKKSNYFEFNVSSNLVENMNIDYEISILKTSTTNSFKESDIKVYLTDQNDNSLVEPVLISELKDNSKITNAKTIYQNNFTYNNSNEELKHTYRLRVWIKDNIDMSSYTIIKEENGKTNISLGSYEFKFKVNVNTIENKTGVDTLIALTNNVNDSGLYTITHSADSTLQIGNDKDITEYRYRGANPKNYVNFNNETWRILGIFPTDDGNGNIENRIKLIRNESIGSYPWDSNGYNNWTKATLNTFLNETYYNGLSANEKELIGNSKYYLGGYNNAITPTPVSMYSNERKISGSAHYYNNNPTNWIGKISLMYASDYGYATENCELKLLYNASSSSNDIRTFNNTNWLYNLKIEEKLLPQYTNASESSVFFLMSNGQIHGIGSSTYGMAIRPVLYLNNNVKIKNGDGTESNPYVFDLEL